MLYVFVIYGGVEINVNCYLFKLIIEIVCMFGYSCSYVVLNLLWLINESVLDWFC